MLTRTFWRAHKLSDYLTDDETAKRDDRECVDESRANLISSLCGDGSHMPVIDLDIPHRYVESSTPGHGHLYLDVPMSWESFEALLDALHDAGVIEAGFWRLSKLRKAAFVRRLGVRKVDADTTDPWSSVSIAEAAF